MPHSGRFVWKLGFRDLGFYALIVVNGNLCTNEIYTNFLLTAGCHDGLPSENLIGLLARCFMVFEVNCTERI